MLTGKLISRNLFDKHIEEANFEVVGEGECSEEFKNRIIEKFERSVNFLIRRLIISSVFILIVLTLTCLFKLYAIAYTNFAITNFQQSFLICKPYIENNKEEIILSQYSQIKSRDDYLKIMSELKHIADSNNIKLPDFTAL